MCSYLETLYSSSCELKAIDFLLLFYKYIGSSLFESLRKKMSSNWIALEKGFYFTIQNFLFADHFISPDYHIVKVLDKKIDRAKATVVERPDVMTTLC